MTTISNMDEVIDSRDIIERIEELETEINDLMEELETEMSFDEFIAESDDELVTEYNMFIALQEEASNSPDWSYGEALIRRSYFVDYIEELINDCYEMPKEMNSGRWPFNHMTMDYEAAAEDAEQDYMSVDFDGVEYLIRA